MIENKSTDKTTMEQVKTAVFGWTIIAGVGAIGFLIGRKTGK